MSQAIAHTGVHCKAWKNFMYATGQGNMVPLGSLITSKVIEAPAVISHYNIYRSVEINGGPKPGVSSGQAIEALREVAKTLPAGYGFEFSGMSREEILAGNQQSIIFAISLVFVFLFLAALYESWSIPFSVLFAVPIGALGSIITLTLLPKLSNNIYAQIGLITLIGLAAKNAILIVEFAKERVDTGIDITHATLQAVKLRLRPIIMTSLAFILVYCPWHLQRELQQKAVKQLAGRCLEDACRYYAGDICGAGIIRVDYQAFLW